MYFYIKQYRYAISRRKHWIPLAVIPVILYLALSAFLPDRFVVSKSLEIDRDAPVAVAGSPVDVVKMSDLMARPDELFLEPYALSALGNNLNPILKQKIVDLALPDLRTAIKSLMTLRSTDDAHVQILCTSADPHLGEALTELYAERLEKRGRDGLERSRVAGRAEPARDIRVTGAAQVSPQRAMWRLERLAPAVQIFLGSLISLLVLMGVVGLSHGAFMSERQVARYLGVKVFGALPNLENMPRSIKTEPVGRSAP